MTSLGRARVPSGSLDSKAASALLASIAVLLGCGGLLGPDPARLAELDRALAEAEPEQAVDGFVRGSIEAGSVRFGSGSG